MSETKRIILAANQPPHIDGVWTVGEIRAAAEFLARWVDAQQVQTVPPPEIVTSST